MKYTETPGDLFRVDPSYTLAHCISADCRMNAGIARVFNSRYPGMKTYCMSSAPQVGTAIYYSPPNQNPPVFNLVTKRAYFMKPSYESVKKSLEDMKEKCQENSIKRIAMPRIGAGLDKLEWPKVRAIIRHTFNDTDIEICVKGG